MCFYLIHICWWRLSVLLRGVNCSSINNNCEVLCFWWYWLKLLGKNDVSQTGVRAWTLSTRIGASWLDPNCALQCGALWPFKICVSWTWWPKHDSFFQREWSQFTRIYGLYQKGQMCMMETLIANHAAHDCCLCACAAKWERKKNCRNRRLQRSWQRRGLTLILLPVAINVSKWDIRFKGPYQLPRCEKINLLNWQGIVDLISTDINKEIWLQTKHKEGTKLI